MKSRFFCLAIVAFISACNAPKGKPFELASAESSAPVFLDTNDVSFLFPLPTTVAGIDSLLPISDSSRQIAMLSQSRLDLLQTLATTDQDDLTFVTSQHLTNIASWRIVALRIDPCAKAVIADTTCAFEFRLVAQQIEIAPRGTHVAANDQTIHLNYVLSEHNGAEVVAELTRMKRNLSRDATTGVRLGVHPVLAAEGGAGPLTEALHNLILRFARDTALSAAAVMSNRSVFGALEWRFAKVIVTPDGDRPVTIPSVNTNLITFVNQVRVQEPIRMRIKPQPEAIDNMAAMLALLSANTSTVDAVAIDAALRLSNPDVHTLSSVDCVSCHTATLGLTRAKGAAFLTANDGNPNRFVASARISVGIGDSARNAALRARNDLVRAFGYVEDGTPSIIAFTAFDSAKVAAFLNSRVAD